MWRGLSTPLVYVERSDLCLLWRCLTSVLCGEVCVHLCFMWRGLSTPLFYVERSEYTSVLCGEV